MLKHLPINKLILAVGDALLVIVSFYISYAIRSGMFVDVLSSFTKASIVSLFLFLFIFYVADIYNVEEKVNTVNYIIRLAVAIIIANCLIAAAFYFLKLWYFSRIAHFANVLLVFSFLFSWRFVFEVVSKYGEKPSRVLIVGAGVAGRALYSILDGSNNLEII